MLAPRQAPAASPRVHTTPRRRTVRRARLLAVALALLVAASMWFYVQGVLISYEQADALRYSRPRGNLSDLYPRWLGAREPLRHGREPYIRHGTRQIQAGYYARELDASRPRDPRDQQRFAHPVYVAF